MPSINLLKYQKALEDSDFIECSGKVSKVVGLTIESIGPEVNIGELCKIKGQRKTIMAEVVGFKDNKVLLMPLGDMSGIGQGSTVFSTGDFLRVEVGKNLVGRVIDGMETLLTAKEILNQSVLSVDNSPPLPLDRNRIKAVAFRNKV